MAQNKSSDVEPAGCVSNSRLVEKAQPATPPNGSQIGVGCAEGIILVDSQ